MESYFFNQNVVNNAVCKESVNMRLAILNFRNTKNTLGVLRNDTERLHIYIQIVISGPCVCLGTIMVIFLLGI